MFEHRYKLIWKNYDYGTSTSIFTIINVPFKKSKDKDAIAFVRNHVLLRDYVKKNSIIKIIPL